MDLFSNLSAKMIIKALKAYIDSKHHLSTVLIGKKYWVFMFKF